MITVESDLLLGFHDSQFDVDFTHFKFIISTKIVYFVFNFGQMEF